MSGSDGITVSRIAPEIMLVRLNRPPHNVLELPLIAGVADAYEHIAALPEARVTVLAVAGKNFSAGANFGGTPERGDFPAGPLQSVPRIGSGEAYAQGARLLAAPLPVVAAVRGAAIGGGLGLACTADFRVGSAETRLAANVARLGVPHGCGLTVMLPQLVGWQHANELRLTGKRIRGEERDRIGLLDRFIDGHELEAAAIAFAGEIASAAPLAVRAIRATMRLGLVEHFRAATEWESQEQARLSATQDFREGVRAGAARRPPRFAGN